MANPIPIVDFSSCSLDTEDWSPSSSVADDIIKAFKDIGFVCLVNYGIKDEQIKKVNLVAERFFNFPQDIKAKYRRAGSDSNQGWIGLDQEK